MIQTYSLKQDGNRRLSPHFQVYEFGRDGGDTVKIDSELVDLLEKLYAELVKRGHAVKAIHIVSGYRTDANASQHALGKAADFNVELKGEVPGALKRGNGWYLDAKFICTALQDLGCEGIGYMGGRAAHCDMRTSRWWGDEVTGDDHIDDWYRYFNLEKPDAPAPEEIPSIFYQVYTAERSWLPEVKDTTDYAGLPNQKVQGVRARLTAGSIEYRVHIANRWLPWVKDHQDYAGLYGIDADGVQMRLVGLDGYAVEYRVARTGGDYWAWVRNWGEGSEGYAGSFGISFDKLQCRIVRE